MDPKDKINVELEEKDGIPQYITVERLENAAWGLPVELPTYQGEGANTFSPKHDKEKLAYIASLGVKMPESCVDAEGEVTDRAILQTVFIVLGHLVALEEMRRLGMNMQPIIEGVNKKLYEKRVNQFGDRTPLRDRRRVEDVYRERGLACNPDQQVSPEEMDFLVFYLFSELQPQT